MDRVYKVGIIYHLLGVVNGCGHGHGLNRCPKGTRHPVLVSGGIDQNPFWPRDEPCVLGPEINANRNWLFHFDNERRKRAKPFQIYEVFVTFKHPFSTNRGNIKSNNSVEGFPQTCNSNCSVRPSFKACSANRAIASSNFSQVLDLIADHRCVSAVGSANPMVIR